MELWDIYDADRRPTGKTMRRGDVFGDGAFHLVVHVCIFGCDGRLLIQQRQPFKQVWPDLWDITVGGGVVAGETSREAAERETLEEIGLRVDLTHIRPALSVSFDNGFDDIYLLEKDVDTACLRLQPEEVRAAGWAAKEEVFAMIDAKIFISYQKSLIALLFDLHGHSGVQSVERL